MEIKDIKSKLSLADVLKHYHLEPDRNQRLCCPFHEEKTPSLQIYPKTNTWTCFSSNCDAGSGDTIEMIQRLESLGGQPINKHQAIMKAKKLLGYHPEVTTKTAPSLQDQFSQMRSSLLNSKKALQYLSDRNLSSKLEIGYNSYQSGYKQLQNCITFPLKDNSGNITSLYGRSISDLKGSNHYYLKNRKGLYPDYPNEDTTTIIVTEAVIDAATILSHTEYKVLSLYGTNGWNEEHTEAIKSLSE